MANLGYFRQLSDVRVWKNLDEDTLKVELMNFYAYHFPPVRSRNLKLRLIEARLKCKYGQCLLSYDELKQVIVDGVALPVSVAA